MVVRHREILPNETRAHVRVRLDLLKHFGVSIGDHVPFFRHVCTGERRSSS